MKLKIRNVVIAAIAVATAIAMASLGSVAASASSGHGRARATKGPWVIGYSNGYYGNAARVQIEAEAKAYAALPAVAPHIKKFIINNAGVSVAAQLAAVDAMIAEHVNAIILDSNSLTGLNPAIAAAHKAGIVVVAENDKVNSPLAYQIATVGPAFGSADMQGLVSLLHGHGNIVELRGIAGNAVDAAEASGFNAVVAKNPGIHVLNVSYGNWDDAQAQSIMASLLSRYSNINGVFTEGGMEQGVVRAYVAAHHSFVPVTGTDENGFACQLKQYHAKRLTGFQVGSQLWESALALKTVLALLSGQKEPHLIPIAPISWGTSKAISLCNQKLSPSLFLNFDNPAAGITLSAAQVEKFMH